MNGLSRRVDAGVAFLQLDRPDKHNAVNAPMLQEFLGALAEASDDEAVKLVVLTGAGKSFCAGGDLTGRDTDGADEAANQVVRAITEIPKPVVAGVRGAASGVGCALALACDLVVAARSAFFHFAFTRVGLMPDGGTSTLLAATIGRARAARVVLMAERLPAQQAFDWGMISHVVDDDDYDTELAAVVGALATGPTEAYGLSKQALRASTLSTLPHVQALEAGGQRSLAGTEYFRRAASAFRNRSRPEAPVATSHSKSKDHI